MNIRNMKAGAAIMASVLATNLSDTATAQNGQNSPGEYFQIHENMQNNPGAYARNLYLAYIKGPDDNLNQLAKRGMIGLARQAIKQTSIEPAGIVGLDIEQDDLSLFPFIYWPVNENLPPLSEDARLNIQDHTGRDNLVIIDFADGNRLSTSKRFKSLVDELQIRTFEKVGEGHLLTQSFYILENLAGTFNREVLVERIPQDRENSDMTAYIIGDANWAGAWSGITVGPDIAEEGLRSGLNMLFAALMGTYKLDALHQPTIEQKRMFQRQQKERREARETEDGVTDQQEAPPTPEQ